MDYNKVYNRLMEHYEKAKELVPGDKIIGIFFKRLTELWPR